MGATDKISVSRSFGNASSSYDEVASLQRQICIDLLSELNRLDIRPNSILDLGAGTGFGASMLSRQYPSAGMILVDIAAPMLTYARSVRTFSKGTVFLCGDAENLPLASQSVDVLFSNVALQWCGDLGKVVREINRILAPNGVAAVSLFVGDTLRELRNAWERVDSYAHVIDFFSAQRVFSEFGSLGFDVKTTRCKSLEVEYSSVFELMTELKRLGAKNQSIRKQRALTGKNKLKQMTSVYETSCDGRIIASYQAALCLAVKVGG